jgi:hypothetical protein
LSHSAVRRIGLPNKCRHPAGIKVTWCWRNYTEFYSEQLQGSDHLGDKA